MEKEIIKSTLNTEGWLLIEQMLKDEFLNTPIKLDTKDKTNEMIASDIKGQELSAKAINQFLGKLNRIKGEIEEKPKRFI